MDERSKRTRPPTTAGPLDGILATKLFPARLRPGFVHRARLVEQLDAGLLRGLVLVCAPAGFGKTGLVADWAETRKLDAGWFSIDDGDNDPARFWRHAVAALDRGRPGIAERMTTLLGPPAPASFEGFVTQLINELAQSEDDEQVLVLDDYDRIDSPIVHVSVTFLLQHRPSALRIVLTSRADPPLPLSRFRAQGDLAELRADDLRFRIDEVATLLREALESERDLGPDLVEMLAVRTEGWGGRAAVRRAVNARTSRSRGVR